MTVNRQIVLKRRPNGVPVPEDFGMIESPMPVLAEGELLIRNRCFSMEPAIRGWLDDKESYFPPIPLGGVIRAPSMGEVVESRHPGFRPGDIVRGLNHWEDYSVLTDSTILFEKLHPDPELPLSYYVGTLGGSGLTAYVGLHDIGRIREGDTVVISAAVGAVGGTAGQIARLRGCRVVGLVGSEEKAQFALERLGYHAVINYRTVTDLAEAVRATCPEGVDVYFDNVGGATLDAMLVNMRTYGRIISCGMIAAYNRQDNPPPILNLWEMVARQLEMKGFLLQTYAASIPAAQAQLEAWIKSGELVVQEYKRHGLENAPLLFCELMSGRTTGKAVLEIP